MYRHLTYITIDFFCILFPFIFSFHPKINFYKKWKSFFTANFIAASFFIIWDIIFTYKGVWSFNNKYITGVYFFNLPIEEVLFFFCIPYACVFTYYCITLFSPQFVKEDTLRKFNYIFIVGLLSTAVFNLEKLYTSVTFILLALFLLFLQYKKFNHFAIFYKTFLIILLPFFISNGILTGSFLDEPVVSYNDFYNLGIRMITIPFEDTFYGMFLILLTVYFFEKLNVSIS